MPGTKIFEPSSPEHFDAARRLFKEYMDYVFTLPGMTELADLKNHETELAQLEQGKYTPPEGTILLALHEGEFLGAVALRKFTDEICEMKRLYVHPKGRGASIGLQLAQQIIQKAREMGYQKMRLDSHPALTKARQLYVELGFYDIPKYNQNEIPGAIFMEMEFKG
jgi:N-acetylglutamate synthase-like GNAT family acetyltransferase